MSFEGLKEALEFVVDNSQTPPTEFKTINGKVYANSEMHYIEDEKLPEYKIVPLEISTLNGFIDYVKANRDGIDLTKTLIQVTGASSVRLISVPGEKLQRSEYICSHAELPQIPFGKYLPHEDFMIMLQSMFVKNEHRDVLLKYVGNIKEDESVSVTDDGVSQKIVAHTGVANVDAVILPNPVNLKPYRTFQELEQPETEFVLRVKKGGFVALFEADGSAWKVKCRALIKSALVEALNDVEGVCFIS
jgi:hypothetical protein